MSQLMVVEAAQVRRRKQNYSRERNKIFLRQLCQQTETGVWVVKVIGVTSIDFWYIHSQRYNLFFLKYIHVFELNLFLIGKCPTEVWYS